MLVRCNSEDQSTRAMTELVNDVVISRNVLSSLTVGNVYRPFGISIRVGVGGGLETFYLVASDEIPGTPISLTFHSASKFMIIESSADSQWEVLHQTRDSFFIGLPLLRDLEKTKDELLAGDPVIETIVKDYIAL